MDVRQIFSKQEAKRIFCEAFMFDDRNAKNYSQEQFELGWKQWLGFFVLQDANKTVAFCGIRQYGNHARIFDRYFVHPDYRKQGLDIAEHSMLLVKTLINSCEDKIPFFSIEHRSKRPALLRAIDRFNSVLPVDKQFHALDGLYQTAPNSWQNIAILKPHKSIDLERIE